MPSQPFTREHGQALLNAIQGSDYALPEDVVSAELPSTAIPELLKEFSKAREDVKISIRAGSRNSAQDVDGWIAQAKQLRHDIEDTQRAAKQIVDQDKRGEYLQAQVQDAAAKVDLLEEEVDFMEDLVAVYRTVGELCQNLDTIQEVLQQENPIRAASELVAGEAEIRNLRASPNTSVISVLRVRFTRLREDASATLLGHWRDMIRVSLNPHTVSIKHQSSDVSTITLDSLAKALHTLGLLSDTVSQFCRDVEKAILRPMLKPQHTKSFGSLSVDGNTLTLSGTRRKENAEEIFRSVRKLIEYLTAQLPSSITDRIPDLLGSALVDSIVSSWLPSAVPIDLDCQDDFRSIVESVLTLADALEGYKWPGRRILVDWTKQIPQIWLKKRQEVTLEKVRRSLASGLGDIETVERIETQILSKKEDIFPSAQPDDSWNAEWSDEEEGDQSAAKAAARAGGDNLEEEISAWDLGEDAVNDKPQTQDDNDDPDAWGWGDEEEVVEKSVSPKAIQTRSKEPESNGLPDPAPKSEREVTLKENYNITALPRDIFELITRAISDAEDLRKPEYRDMPIAPASTGLLALPELILTMYRASAPSCYSLNQSGNMFLYNDSLWLAERLQRHDLERSAPRGRLLAGVSALSAFGKRAYGREMESQRTILSDLLDGAQGFSNCTHPPFAQGSELAIRSIVDRLHQVYHQWQPVLSYSALLQSLGSLLSTIVNKIIIDIEDLSDISEPESRRLTELCNMVASVENIFQPQRQAEGPEPEEAEEPEEPKETKPTSMPLTAVYTPGWLKFQYLVNILESSLVDIRFLWEEGELRLEFEVEELVDLIEALFADSEHRRRAIGDIRRMSSN